MKNSTDNLTGGDLLNHMNP